MPRASKAKAPDCGFTETGCNYSRKRAEITHGPKCPLLLAARKPKAQRERVVVAWAVCCASGKVHVYDNGECERLLFYVPEDGGVSDARDQAKFMNDHREVSEWSCGPHRVVRLEGRVKVGGK